MRRTEGGFEPIGWGEALDEVAARLHAIQEEHGVDAVASYAGNPVVHNEGLILSLPLLLNDLKSRNRYTASSVDQLPQYMTSYFMFGHQLLFPVTDVDRTSFLLVLGGNPVVSNGSILTAPNMRKRIKDIVARGGEVVVVDPRRTETAELATSHHYIVPGRDPLLLMAMLHTIFAEGRVRLGRLADMVDQLDKLADIVDPVTPESVAEDVGIGANEIRELALRFADADCAVAYGRLGVCLQPWGTLTHWLINALNVVTGNLDRPGGAMFTTPAVDMLWLYTLAIGKGSYNRWQSRVARLPEFGGDLPVVALADEILTPGRGQVRGLLLVAGNPVLSTPDGRRMAEALEQLDFVVAIDPYLNESTRHADIILPPARSLEYGHYDIVFSGLAVRNVARYSPPVFPRRADTPPDWKIVVEIHERLLRLRGGFAALKGKLHGAIFSRLCPEGIVDLLLRVGPRGSFRDGLTLEKVKRHKHGIDFGPLEPTLPGRLQNEDKRIKLVPDVFHRAAVRMLRGDGFPRLADGQLLLIGRRHLRSNNSWMHNSQRLVRGKERCTLLIHPNDAHELGIRDGQQAVVSSSVGSLQLPAVLSDEVMPGVVSIPHGWGHDRPGTRLSVASSRPGVSVNDITDAGMIDKLTGNAAVNQIPVKVRPCEDGPSA